MPLCLRYRRSEDLFEAKTMPSRRSRRPPPSGSSSGALRCHAALLLAVVLSAQHGASQASLHGGCTPLEDVFADGVYEDVVQTFLGPTMLGAGSTVGINLTGAINVWSSNPLYVKSDGGDGREERIIGEMSGRCTQLPDPGYRMCYAIFKFSEDSDFEARYMDLDTITISGAVSLAMRESMEPLVFAVTGGTGCYDHASGTLTMTPQDAWVPPSVTEARASSRDVSPRIATRAKRLWTYNNGGTSTSSPSGEACVPIRELFGDGLVEDNTGGGNIVGDYETPGSLDTWFNNTLTNSRDEVLGYTLGECTLLPRALNYFCMGQFVLGSGDMFTFAGTSPNSMDIGTIAVTGGTGCYSETTATLTLVPANEDYTAYLWGHVDPPTPRECISKTLCGSPRLYTEENGAEIIGDQRIQGSLDLWDNRALYGYGDDAAREPVGASSYGHCTLLTGSLEWFCVSQIMLDDGVGGSTIVMSGYTPNSIESGTLSINGGSGCFDGIRGEISFTALSTKQQYDYLFKSIDDENSPVDKDACEGVQSDAQINAAGAGSDRRRGWTALGGAASAVAAIAISVGLL